MADRFFIFGAAFNGDGTTSAEAGSNGGVGAWSQDTILTGTAPTYGTLSAGDTVYIRSKNGNGANTDITKTLTVNTNLGNASGTATDPITWILDNGTKWSGINGTLTYQDGAATNYSVTLRDNNNFVASTKWNWIFKAVNTSANNSNFLIFGQGYTKGLFQDAAISVTAGRACSVGASKYSVNTDFKLVGSRTFSGMLDIQGSTTWVFVNPTFEAPYNVASSGTKPIFYFSGPSSTLRLIGGSLSGAGATSGVPILGIYSGSVTNSVVGVGFTWPIGMMSTPLSYNYSTQNQTTPYSFVGADNGIGAVLVDRWGQMDSRRDANYPSVNAVLPNSVSTGFSWKLIPYRASPVIPIMANVANKLFVDTAATKTVTLAVLIANTIVASCNKSNSWIEVTYIDNSTGVSTTVVSRDFAAGALDTSTAAWTSSNYGPISCTKKQFSITTPTAIKQDTQIQVTLMSTIGQPTSIDDVWFVDPDVQVS